MKAKHPYVIPIILFLLAAGIYGWRKIHLNKKQGIKVLEVVNGQPEVHFQFFQRMVVDANPKRFQALITQAVFVDPMTDCPGYLFDARNWTAPWFEYPTHVYNLVLFMPEETDPGIRLDFMENAGIPKENCVVYSPDSPIRALRSGGLLKTVFSLDAGLMYSEFGKSIPSEQEASQQKINQIIQKSL